MGLLTNYLRQRHENKLQEKENQIAGYRLLMQSPDSTPEAKQWAFQQTLKISGVPEKETQPGGWVYQAMQQQQEQQAAAQPKINVPQLPQPGLDMLPAFIPPPGMGNGATAPPPVQPVAPPQFPAPPSVAGGMPSSLYYSPKQKSQMAIDQLNAQLEAKANWENKEGQQRWALIEKGITPEMKKALGESGMALMRMEALAPQTSVSLARALGGASQNLRWAPGETSGEDLIAQLQAANIDLSQLPNPPIPGRRYRWASNPATGIPVIWSESLAPQYSFQAQQFQEALKSHAQTLKKPIDELTPEERATAWQKWQERFPQSLKEIVEIGPDGKPIVRQVAPVTAAGKPSARTLYNEQGIPTTAGITGLATTLPPPVPTPVQDFLASTGRWLDEMRAVSQDLYSGKEKTLGPAIGRLKLLEVEKFGGVGANAKEIELATRLHRLVTEAAFANGGKQLTETEFRQFERLTPSLSDTVQQALIKSRQSIQYLKGKMAERTRMLGYRQFMQLPQEMQDIVAEYKPREWQTRKAPEIPPALPAGSTEEIRTTPDGKKWKKQGTNWIRIG